MREILFRGKRLKDKKWIEGSLLVLDADSGYYFITEPYKSASTLPVRDLIYNHTHLVDPETVCQFTGLTDKNGVKIFEGDICKNIKNEEIVLVKWHGTMAGYVWIKRRKDNKYLFNFGELFRVSDKYEVIGNIFDNPELMKGGESDETD